MKDNECLLVDTGRGDIFGMEGGIEKVPNEPVETPVGCAIIGPEVGKPVGCATRCRGFPRGRPVGWG